MVDDDAGAREGGYFLTGALGSTGLLGAAREDIYDTHRGVLTGALRDAGVDDADRRSYVVLSVALRHIERSLHGRADPAPAATAVLLRELAGIAPEPGPAG